MNLTGFDHIVLAVADVVATVKFYETHLAMKPVEERPGKWALQFGTAKISLQEAAAVPEIAKGTVPGSGNFCILSDDPVEAWVKRLTSAGVEIVASGERIGAVGPIQSIYFHDPDGNLVEIANAL